MKETRQRILDVALALFNEEGLNGIGFRDVARAAEMSVGNLAYHFPTKGDLVMALVTELHELNQRTIFCALPEPFRLVTLYRSALAVMRNMLVYRFVLLSYVDAVSTSPRLRAVEASLGRMRQERHRQMLEALIRCGDVDREAQARSEILYEQGSMISSGWLAAAALRGMPDEAAVLHFAKLGCALLEPHLTASGKRQLRQIRNGTHDGG
jgi:AcrR family transcriptional regulator